jgi:hypothetical protein
VDVEPERAVVSNTGRMDLDCEPAAEAEFADTMGYSLDHSASALEAART